MSVTFCLVVLGQVKLEHMFVQFYGTICLAGVVAAIVLPYLPPLRNKPDTFIDGFDHMKAEGGHFSRTSVWSRAFSHGLHRASMAPGVKATAVVDWLKSDFDLGHGHAMSIVAWIKGKRS